MEPLVHFDQKKAMIRKQACFADLTNTEVDELTTLLTEKIFYPGEVIVNEGDIVDSVFLIVKGVAEVQHISIVDGQTKIERIAKLGPDQAIGLNERGFYSISGVRTATVVADSEMLVLRLSVAAFHGFALMHSHVNEVMRSYASRSLR